MASWVTNPPAVLLQRRRLDSDGVERVTPSFYDLSDEVFEYVEVKRVAGKTFWTAYGKNGGFMTLSFAKKQDGVDVQELVPTLEASDAEIILKEDVVGYQTWEDRFNLTHSQTAELLGLTPMEYRDLKKHLAKTAHISILLIAASTVLTIFASFSLFDQSLSFSTAPVETSIFTIAMIAVSYFGGWLSYRVLRRLAEV